MTLNTIPRSVVKTYLRGARLPLTGVETLTGQRGNDAWPPALAFEEFEAGTKLIVGSVLRDQQLVDEGRVQQAKLREIRRATALEVKAEQTRATADAQMETRLERAEQRSRQAEEQAEQRIEAAQERQRREEQEANRKQAQRAQTIAETDAAREKRLAKTERATRLRTIEAESAAVTSERRAVEAVDKVATLDKALEQKKSQRKSS